RHTSFSRDWSSDVCSSDLMEDPNQPFYKVEPPKLLERDDFVDVLLEEAAKQMKIYMILQKGSDAKPAESVASTELPATVGMQNRSEERRVGKQYRAALETT